MPDNLSEGVGEYLEAIYKLSQEGGPVPLPLLAERLKVSLASTNEMVWKLAERGLAHYEPYKGVWLTDEGRIEASRVIRRHRLWERFLLDFLGISWDRVHEEACRLEHATSALVEESLARFLDAPDSCPHGHRIPTADGRMPQQECIPLSKLAVGQEGEVVSVPEEEPTLLQYLGQLSMKPGQRLLVREIQPFGGPICVSIEGKVQPLSRQLSEHIMVRQVGG